LKKPPIADVEAFGVFAEDDKADVVGGDVAKRGVAWVKELVGRA